MPAGQELVEKVIESKEIYRGRVVHLVVDTVEMPNGKTARREVVRHSGAVAIVPVDSAGQIIMVRQYRHPIGRVLLEIPAGMLNQDEDPFVGARRELQEEIGYAPGQLDKLGGVYLAPGYSSEFIHLFLATNLVPSRLDMDEDEFIELEHVTLSQVFDSIQSGQIADAKTVAALMLYKDRLK